LQQRAGGSGRYAEKGEDCERNRDAIAADELAGAIHQRVGASSDRFAFEIAAKIARKQTHGCVALSRIFFESFEQNGVKIAL
jgi:hypothetical protein